MFQSEIGVMLDLETLGLDDDAVILQIALTPFDKNFNQNPSGIPSFNETISVVQSLIEGFTVTQGTLNFWKEQLTKTDVHSKLFEGVNFPQKVANLLSEWLKEYFDNEYFDIWSNRILFDIPKVDGLLKKYDLQPLTAWTKYNRIYDFPGYVDSATLIYPNGVETYKRFLNGKYGNLVHNALADCDYQIDLLKFCYTVMTNAHDTILVKDYIERVHSNE